jgi:hypothetical protein
MQKGRLKSPRIDTSADVNTDPQHPINLKSFWCSGTTNPITQSEEPVDGVVDLVGGATVERVDRQSSDLHGRSTNRIPVYPRPNAGRSMQYVAMVVVLTEEGSMIRNGCGSSSIVFTFDEK